MKSGGEQAVTGAGATARSAAAVLSCVGLALLLQFVLKPMIGDYFAKVMLDIGTNIILGVSLTMVNGFTGQFSMGHAAFMMVGGYVAAMLVYYGSIRVYGDPAIAGGVISGMTKRDGVGWMTGGDVMFLSAVLAGGLAAAGCGYVVGLPSLRLRGDYLAIVTLGFGEIVRVLITALTTESISIGSSVSAEHLAAIPAWKGVAEYDPITAEMAAQVPWYLWPKYVGGSLGFVGLPPYNNLFWVFLFATMTILVARRLKSSTYGRAFLSIREDEIASEAMGVDTSRYKIRAFVIAAFFAGCAGGLFAHTSGVLLSPSELGFQKSFDIIILVVLGGLGSVSGASIAAVLLTLLSEWLRDPGHVYVYGAVVMVAALVISKRKARAAAIVAGATAGVELVRWLAVKNGIKLESYRMVIYALMLILMMILRPKGLLGVREIWDGAFWRELLGKGAKGSVKA